jgi:hypothetical protein
MNQRPLCFSFAFSHSSPKPQHVQVTWKVYFAKFNPFYLNLDGDVSGSLPRPDANVVKLIFINDDGVGDNKLQCLL